MNEERLAWALEQIAKVGTGQRCTAVTIARWALGREVPSRRQAQLDDQFAETFKLTR